MSASAMIMQYRTCAWLLLVLFSTVTEQHDVSSDGSLYVYSTGDSTLDNTGNSKAIYITQDPTIYEIKDPPVQITKDSINLSTESSSVYSTEDSLEYSTGSAFPYITRNPTLFTGSPPEHITGTPPAPITAGQQVFNSGSTQSYVSIDTTTNNTNKSLNDREDQSSHHIRNSVVNSGWKSLNFHRNDEIARSVRNPIHYNSRHHSVHSTRKPTKKLRKRHPPRKTKSRKRSRKKTYVTGRPYTGVYVIPDMMCALCSRQRKRGRRQKCKMMFCHSKK